MEMSLREWLIVVGVVIILGVVLDGYRRIRRAKKDSLEMSMGMGGHIDNTPLDEGYGSELPGGGARVVRPSSKPEYERPKIYSGAKTEASEISNNSEYSHNLDSNVDDRIDPSVDSDVSSDHSQYCEATDADDFDISMEKSQNSDELENDWQQGEPDWDDSYVNESFSATDDVDENPVHEIEQASEEEHTAYSESPDVSDEKASGDSVPVDTPQHLQTESKGRFGSLLNRTLKGWSKNSQNESDVSLVEETGPSEVVVVSVMSKAPEGFKGMELKALFEACGMIHGDMSIFHRHEEVDQSSPIQFSVANSVEPGYFDKSNMESLRTPGVSFFLSLPGPTNNIQAFDYMIETAQCLVRNLNGELKDERRSVMTAQTIEHYRQKVRDFERKQLSAKV